MSLRRLIVGPVGAMSVMAAALPAGAVVAARFGWPVEGPTAAKAAATPVTPSEPIVWVTQDVSESQKDVQTKVKASMATSLGPTPFVPPTPVAIKTGKAVVAQTPLAKRAGDFAVTSILNGQQPVAIVNGKVCRVGGKILSKAGETWVVTVIDAVGGRVEVENAAIGTLELKLPVPSER